MMNEFAPLFQKQTPDRKPGRPKGSKAKVVQEARALGVHHFAFVRSTLLGLDLADSFNRYLAWSETTSDLRYVQNRREALLKQIIEAGRQYDATLQPADRITHLLDLLRSDAAPAKTVQLPTLEDWVEAEGMDPDAWSEAELIAEYKAHFGLDNADAQEATAQVRDPVGERVKALNHLETVLARIPAAADRLESWFARPVVTCLRNVGIVSLADLVKYVNLYGYRWHSRIKGFGEQRAKQVLLWLILQQEKLNLLVTGSVHEPKTKVALRLAPVLPALGDPTLSLAQFGVGTVVASQLGRMQVQPELTGERGTFRSHMPNTLGARTDVEAVNAWLARYQDKTSTLRSYRKESERFLLWCAQELRKPLSSVTAVDCQAYRVFLQAVPRTWIEPAPLKRSDPGWRAFRGQPSAASQRQALIILQALFSGLVDAGYLVANPMKALIKSFDLPHTRMDLTRSFTEKEWRFVLHCVQELPEGAERTRLQCILELLVSSGLRLEELANARHRNLRLENLPELPQTWVLTVTGKRNKTRDIPLQAEVVQLLAQHGAQFRDEDSANPDQAEIGLVRTLYPSVGQWGQGEGGVVALSSKTERPGAPISAAGIYAVLKRFFRWAAKRAPEAGLEPARFEKASTHWMRHTFVRQALVDGVPIEVASNLAGHASLATTSIYSTQELARKIKAVQGMKRRVA